MKKLKELIARRAEIIEELRSILDAADAEKRDISEDEETRYTELETELTAVEADINVAEAADKRRDDLAAREAELKKPANQPPRMAATYRADDPGEFKTIGEFLFSVRFNRNDRRLYDLYEERAQSMGVGSEGGFAVPTQFRETLLSVSPQQAIFRPRATVIPAGDPPDSEISMPALDQGSAKNMYGGIAFNWIAEGATKPETDMALREVTLKPHELAGYTVLTDKLLRNWQAASSVLETQFRLALIAAQETSFYNGTGVGQPIGILSSPARIDYARATANTIAYADVAGMYARLRMNMAPVWIASQTTIPQLVNIADAGSNNLWVQNAAADLPPSLLGIPVLFHERSVALGTKGDLVLADLSYYLIKDGSGPFVSASEHVYFTSNKTVIKIFTNVDGKSWLNEPIPLEGSTANTVSPFVVLN